MSEAMEAVKVFNNELSSLYESKPPVSRAKMARITKSAIKAVKFYKHVVQSVEKFILKCRTEYKVPGLYVVDSIVRQSRHQFGVEKDVFAQRFSKNIIATFQNLVSCPEDDRNKIVRVLHLWQKNSVFSPEIMKQLFSMTSEDGSSMGASAAASAGDDYLIENPNSQQSDASDDEEVRSSQLPPKEPTRDSTPEKTKARSFAEIGDKAPIIASQSAPGNGTETGTNVSTDMLSAVVQLLQSSQQPITQLLQHQLLQQLPQPLGSLSLPQQLLQQLNHPPNSSSSMPVSSVPLPPQPPTPQVQSTHHQLPQQRQVEKPSQGEMLRSAVLQFDRRSEENSQGSEPLFNKSLLEFDYGESDDEDNRKGVRSARMEEEIRPPPQRVEAPTFPNHQFHPQALENSGSQSYQMAPTMPALPQHLQPYHQQQQQQQLHPNQSFPPQPEDRSERHEYFHGKTQLPAVWQPENNYEQGYEGNYEMQQQQQQNLWQEQENSMFENREQQPTEQQQRFRGQEFEENNQPRDRNRVRDQDDKRRRRSRDRSRSPRGRRGHSRNDSSKRSRSKDRRRRSRSRDRSRRSRSRSQDRNRDRERRERERDRRSRGMPPLLENHLCVCSTTLWIGHLSKHTKENELKEEMSKYGETTSFNLIPPRGCAFISFSSRKEASRALDKLKGSKISGNAIKVAWAMGVGMKESELKDVWDVEQGVSYIPWNRIPENVDDLAEGGFVDEDSLPEEVKIARKEWAKGKENAAAGNSQAGPGHLTSTGETTTMTMNNRSMAEGNMPALPPPMPALPSGVMPPLLPPPPGFMPPMMVPGGVPPMMRMPPPPMHGMMPPMGSGLLPPPPRLGMPPGSATSMEDAGASESEKGSEKTAAGSTSECMPPMVPPGMAYPWQMPPNMRPGMMPFRPPPMPFMAPNAFGRMPFLPAPPRFHGPGESREEMQTPDGEGKTESQAEASEDSVEKGEHGDMDPGVPPPPEGAQHQPWPPGGMGGPHGGPRPDFMGMRPRMPFGPPGFAGGGPRMPEGRAGRHDMEELPEGEDSEHAGGEAEMEAGGGGMEEHGFQGPDNRGFPPHFGSPGRGGRPPWFGGPRGPPGPPLGMRMPRFPFEDPRMNMRPPPFRLRGPPPGLMGDDPRFNGPPQGFRGRPPFSPRGPGMPNFCPPMDMPFGRPPFQGRGPRPLFPRGRPDFGFPPDSAEEEYYEENPDGGEGDAGDWNEGGEKGEEQWNEDGNEGEEEAGYGRRQGRWKGCRDEDEGHGRRPWRGNDRRNDEMESGGRWGGGNRRDWDEGRGRGGGRWGGHNRMNRDEEEGGGGRRRGNQRRNEDEGRSRDRRHQDDQWNEGGDVAEEEPNPKRGRWTGDEERKPQKSSWGEFFDDTTGEVMGLEETKEPEPHVADRTEKKPRKTRWSSAEPVVQPLMEPSEISELEETAAEPSQLPQENASLANESEPPVEELSSNTPDELADPAPTSAN